jgi:hypothetical protein
VLPHSDHWIDGIVLMPEGSKIRQAGSETKLELQINCPGGILEGGACLQISLETQKRGVRHPPNMGHGICGLPAETGLS